MSNAASDVVGYFRDENMIFPQIKTKPPYKATKASIAELAQKMDLVSYTLREILPFYTIDENGKPFTTVHEAWASPDNFAWPDLYAAKAMKWKRVNKLPSIPKARKTEGLF